MSISSPSNCSSLAESADGAQEGVAIAEIHMRSQRPRVLIRMWRHRDLWMIQCSASNLIHCTLYTLSKFKLLQEARRSVPTFHGCESLSLISGWADPGFRARSEGYPYSVSQLSSSLVHIKIKCLHHVKTTRSWFHCRISWTLATALRDLQPAMFCQTVLLGTSPTVTCAKRKQLNTWQCRILSGAIKTSIVRRAGKEEAICSQIPRIGVSSITRNCK